MDVSIWYLIGFSVCFVLYVFASSLKNHIIKKELKYYQELSLNLDRDAHVLEEWNEELLKKLNRDHVPRDENGRFTKIVRDAES